MKILNFGSLNIDYVYQVESIVRVGETIRGCERSTYCGGKGLNQSIALANAGAEVYHAGSVGTDGKLLLDKLMEHGVDTKFIKKIKGPSSHTIIQVNSDGDNGIIFYSDKKLTLDDEKISEIMDAFDEGDYLLVQNETRNTKAVMNYAKKKGMKIVLNPSPFTCEIFEFPLETVDIFIMNEIEGFEFTKEKDPEHILDSMHEKYPDAIVILTVGKKGAYCLTNDRTIMQKAYEVDTVDTTAAGDTFTGYFIAEYLRTGILEGSMALAAKAAALAVTLPGAADSIPMLEEVRVGGE